MNFYKAFVIIPFFCIVFGAVITFFGQRDVNKSRSLPDGSQDEELLVNTLMQNINDESPTELYTKT